MEQSGELIESMGGFVICRFPIAAVAFVMPIRLMKFVVLTVSALPLADIASSQWSSHQNKKRHS
jgi:nitrate reductase NapE component